MTAVPQVVVGLPSSASTYINHGWKLCPIPEGLKGPQQAGWNKVENALTEAPTVGGVGLLHAYSGTAALDIDHYELAKTWLAERGVDLDELGGAPNAVAIDSGNPGHGKLIFTLPFPLPSKKIIIDGVTALELRCATANGLSVQDVLPPSKHPSGSTYRWAGRGNWQSLPEIPAQLLTIWGDLLQQDSQRTITIEGTVPASLDEMKSALYAIPADCDRKMWIDCGMALAQSGHADALALWNEWSAQGKKYPGEREIVKQWQSFKPLPTGINIGTLFHHAALSGWRRPTPNMAELFKPIEVTETVEQAIHRIEEHARIPSCDLTLWPSVLVRRAVEIAKEVGCDPVVPLIAGLLAVSGASNKQSSLIINPSWRVPPTFWAMTIGLPSDKKTPGSKPMFTPLRKLEMEDRDRYQTEMLLWQGKEARHAAEMKHYRDWEASAEASMPNAVPPKVTPLPPQPQPLRLVISDATTQKVVTMSENRPHGFLLYLDEMNRWLTKLGDTRTTDDRGCWIQGYETGPYSMDRMGSGTTIVENMALSLYGNCQPEVFRQNVTNTSSDGILQRFMPIVLNPSLNAQWQDALPPFLSCEGEYEQLVRKVYSLPKFEYVFEDTAKEYFREKFSQWCLELRESERIINSSMSYQTALGKIEGNCARLILLFHLIENPYCPAISMETTVRACTVFKSFFVPSLRYVFLEVGEQKDPIYRKIFNLVTQWASAKETVSLSDLRRAVPNDQDSWKNDQRIRVAMDELATVGYVSMFQDHPRYPVWTINPAVAQLFAEHRKQLIKAKQLVRESMTRDMSERAGREVTLPAVIGA